MPDEVIEHAFRWLNPESRAAGVAYRCNGCGRLEAVAIDEDGHSLCALCIGKALGFRSAIVRLATLRGVGTRRVKRHANGH